MAYQDTRKEVISIMKAIGLRVDFISDMLLNHPSRTVIYDWLSLKRPLDASKQMEVLHVCQYLKAEQDKSPVPLRFAGKRSAEIWRAILLKDGYPVKFRRGMGPYSKPEPTMRHDALQGRATFAEQPEQAEGDAQKG